MAQKHPMETYHGIVRTPADAIKLFEACRLGLLPRVQRRLSEKERQAIRSGSVFVWDEREAGMRRWTDGKSWSASRVSGSFLTYREMEGKRGGGFNTMRRVSGKTPDSTGRMSDEEQDDGEPDGYRYKADGLMKQSFSITTSVGQHLHLISYYARPSPGDPDLPHPTSDPALRSVVPVKGMYPESSLADNTPIAAVSRVPINPQQPHHHPHHSASVPPPPPSHYPHHLHHPHAQPPPLNTTSASHSHLQPYPPPPYSHQQPGYSWPPSPNATPPYSHHYAMSSASSSSASYPPPQPPSSSHPHLAPPAPAHSQSPYYHQHPPSPAPLPQPQKAPYSSGPSTAYDPRLSLPPPPALANGAARTTPPYGQQPPPPPSSHLSPHSHHLAGTGSPRSLYRQPTLPPVSTAPSMSASSSGTPVSSSSASTAISSYATPPGSRNTLPPVSLAISALATTMAAASAPHGGRSSSAGPPPALTPPRRLSPSPSASSYANDVASTAPAPSSANKASLSALLHPTPANSEPNSAHAGSNSAGSSPRYIGVPPPALGSPASAHDSGLSNNGSGPTATSSASGPGLSAGPMPQQYLQLAPSGEDTRALSRLDRKFCI